MPLPKHKHRINVYIDVHASSWIQTHDPSFRASEESSCLRTSGCCDRCAANVIGQCLHMVDARSRAVHETPLRSLSAGADRSKLQCLAVRLWRPYSWGGGDINSECCIYTTCKHLGHFSEERIAEAWLQHYSATCHSERVIMHEISMLFRDRIVSKWLWLPLHRIFHHQIFFYGAILMSVLTAIAHEIWTENLHIQHHWRRFAHDAAGRV
jgi:hypothetical protein